MSCGSCPSGGHTPQRDLLVDIVLTLDVGGSTNTQTFEKVSMSRVSPSSGRSISFEDGDGYLHIILLGANDRVEITSREPLPSNDDEEEM